MNDEPNSSVTEVAPLTLDAMDAYFKKREEEQARKEQERLDKEASEAYARELRGQDAEFLDFMKAFKPDVLEDDTLEDVLAKAEPQRKLDILRKAKAKYEAAKASGAGKDRPAEHLTTKPRDGEPERMTEQKFQEVRRAYFMGKLSDQEYFAKHQEYHTSRKPG